MKEENKIEKKFLKKIGQKLSFAGENSLNKFGQKLPKIDKNKNMKSYSTKLAVNFVPTLYPKKSFCKPTFMQLNENHSIVENEKEDSDLDFISSSNSEYIDKSDSNRSSEISISSEENDKEEEKKLDKEIQINNISEFGLNNKNYGKIEDNKNKQISEKKVFKEDEDKNTLNILGSECSNKKTNSDEVDANKEKSNLIQNKISSKKGLSILDILKNKNNKK